MYNKKCAICGYSFAFEDNKEAKEFEVQNKEGAKYFYDLWHTKIEKCPKCEYVSFDISTTKNKLIIDDATYKGVSNNYYVKELQSIRPNLLENYLQAGLYYKSIGDYVNDAICNLQAVDIIYAELEYFKEHFFNTINTVTLLENQKKYNEIEKFADGLYEYAVALLRKFVKLDPLDSDVEILLSGTLLYGNTVQEMEAIQMIKKLRKRKDLSSKQHECIKYLVEMIEAEK